MSFVGARIGIIYPDDGDADADFYEFASGDVSIHITRNAGWSPGYAQDAVEPVVGLREHMTGGHIRDAALRFTRIRPDVVAYGCLSCSFAGGPAYDQEICSLLTEVSGCRSTTGTTALLDALGALGVSNVALVSFYDRSVAEMFEHVLQANGIDAVAKNPPTGIPKDTVQFYESLGVLPGRSHIRTPEMAYRIAKAVDTNSADAVVVTSTGFRTAPMIARLERDLGKPVVTANQALVWHAMQLANVRSSSHHFGKLFDLDSSGSTIRDDAHRRAAEFEGSV